jgi:hypothetical protein
VWRGGERSVGGELLQRWLGWYGEWSYCGQMALMVWTHWMRLKPGEGKVGGIVVG